MNLGDIRKMVYEQIDFNPNLESYRLSVDKRIDRLYQQVCNDTDWLFLHRTATITCYAGVSAVETTREAEAISGLGLRKVTATAGSTVYFDPAYEGHVFVAPDGTEHVIGTVSEFAVPYDQLILADPLSAGFVSPDSYAWSIRFDRIMLPADCAEPLGFSDLLNDRGRLTYVDRRREEEAFLDFDIVGEVSTLVEDNWLSLEAPMEPPKAAAASGGTLGVKHRYVYGYCIVFKGLRSPMSATVEVATTATFKTVELTGLEDLSWSDGGTPRNSGMVKEIYRRDLTVRGRWLYVGKVDDSGTTTFTDDGSLPTGVASWREAPVYYPPEPRRTVRPWPTPSTDTTLVVRYLRRPPPLVADADEPELPDTYHVLLAYLALQDLFLQVGDSQAGVWGDRAKAVEKRMAGRYLAVKARKLRFEMSAHGGGGAAVRQRYQGDPVKL